MDYREELFKALTAGVDGAFRDKSIDALVEVCKAARKEGYDAGLQAKLSIRADKGIEPNDVFMVGDEVKDRYGTIEVITRVRETYAEVMQADGRTFSVGFKTLKRTGRHHPEIAQVMQKMQEGEA